MSIGVGLLVVALGAIFSFAVPNSPPGLDLHVVGVVLMAVGGVGLFLRLTGYGPDNGYALIPRWVQGRRTRIVEERLYDPMAEDPTLYRPAEDPATHRVVEEPSNGHSTVGGRPILRHEEIRYDD